MRRFLDALKACGSYIKLFFEETTLHGLRYIVTWQYHWIERLVWLIIVVFSFGGAVWIILSSYERYRANPTVTTLDKDFRSWNVTLPANTYCFEDKFDEDKAKQLVQSQWNLQDGEEFDFYVRFLKVLSNSSYFTLDDLAEFSDDTRLQEENLSDLMDKVQFEWVTEPTLFNQKKLEYEKIMLEIGSCYTVGSPVTKMFSTSRKDEAKSVLTSASEEIQHCSYFDSMCYGVAEHFPRATIHYVHSPTEIPDILDRYFFLHPQTYKLENFDHFEITASETLRDLQPVQRNCVFYNEEFIKGMPYYSYNLCKVECRRRNAMRLCGCVPHFYTKKGGETICNIKQLQCIRNNFKQITQIGLSKEEATCKCLSSCDYTIYNFEHEELKEGTSALGGYVVTGFSWKISSFSKSRYKRDILFSFEDLLVSFGGTAAFFMGCSLMSGVELVYFFTLRFIRYVKCKRLNFKQQPTKKPTAQAPPRELFDPNTFIGRRQPVVLRRW